MIKKEPRTILIVEDEHAVVDALTVRLAVEGFRVLSAPDGDKGLEVAKKNKPDLVLLDLMMPGTDGFGVCRIMKEDELLKDIPIIILTAKVENDARQSLLKMGADAYIAKPYEWKKLLEEISSLLGG